MRFKLLLLVILFLTATIKRSKQGQGIYDIESVHLTNTEDDDNFDKTIEPVVKTEERKEIAVLTDDTDYGIVFGTLFCGDLPISWSGPICHCGNRTLSTAKDLTNGDYCCCVPPSSAGQKHCQYNKTKSL